jgi:hypothetical protein
MKKNERTKLICRICHTITLKKPGINVEEFQCKCCGNIGLFMEMPICERFNELQRVSSRYQMLCDIAKHVNYEIDLCIKRLNYLNSDAYERELSLEKAAEEETSREVAKLIEMINAF